MDQSRGAERRQSLSLHGVWRFRLDPYGLGGWLQDFSEDGEEITLPGSTDEARKGYSTQDKYLHHLTRVHEYIGPAWYQRTINIPEDWQKKRVVLYLERPHWETTVWLGEEYVGRQDSLCVPHVYDLGQLAAGDHTLTIRVDNTVKIGVGDAIAKGGNTNLAHSITDHTQTNWNGIVGKIELQATDPVWIDDVQIYPDVGSSAARVVLTLGNATGEAVAGELHLEASSDNTPRTHSCPPLTAPFSFKGERTVVEVSYAMDEALHWDEFSPALYTLITHLDASSPSGMYRDSCNSRFGVREFKTFGRQFSLNGRAVFLRGTLECCIFPLTGYPPTDVVAWRRVLDVAKAHGLNHLRFHSYCPPEAAFVAADEMGFMLQVEGPFWAEFGSDPKIDEFAYAEGDRILSTYGNHPSFCLLAVSNEPSGATKEAFFARILEHWRSKDARRVYTSGAGWPTIPENDYHSTPTPRAYRWGEGLSARFNAQPLSTDLDYTDFISQYDVPVVSHEIGQWTAYPDYQQINKYTGVLRARNLEHFRASLAEHSLLDKAEAFVMASGKLQTLLYKEDIEAALRTPEFGGFQLLDLHDFPGQGTALVGVLDAFWDSKGYVSPEAFREFCAETVPLARMAKVVWRTGEAFTAEIQAAHFGPRPLEGATMLWRLERLNGEILASGSLPPQSLPIGAGISLGKVEVPLQDLTAPQQLAFRLMLEGTPYRNAWDLWLYPAEVELPPGIHMTTQLDPTSLEVLSRGESVLLLPPASVIQNDVAFGFTTPFWNTAWARQAPNTMGLLCDPEHPAFELFPTQSHSNWQWWEVTHGTKCLVLDELPAQIDPLIWVIDDWTTNRKLALAFEARLGGGKLLVCSADLRSQLENRPVARQLLHSLLRYMQSPRFEPTVDLDLSALARLGDLVAQDRERPALAINGGSS